jgi:hypothetical protein
MQISRSLDLDKTKSANNMKEKEPLLFTPHTPITDYQYFGLK